MSMSDEKLFDFLQILIRFCKSNWHVNSDESPGLNMNPLYDSC